MDEFIHPTPIEDKYKELLRRTHEEILKPLGFQKDKQNFRQLTPKMLAEMGCQAQVYEQIKGPEHYPYALYQLAQELREQLGLEEEKLP